VRPILRPRLQPPAADRLMRARKEGRIARHVRVAREVREEPRRVGTLVRQGLLNVWRARGGGFYGLGYLIAFLALEIGVLAGEAGESVGVVEFVTGQIFEYLLRFAVMSFVNVALAMIWPVYVVQLLGVWGYVVLGGGYLLFEKVLRPYVETWLPELRVSEPIPDTDSE
jgi:hypothetical protein